MSKDITPIFGLHTSGDVYVCDLRAALNAKGSDLVPPVYGWSRTTANHLINTKPTFLAIDGVDSYTNPRAIPYAFPLDPFELKGSRERMFLVGTDVLYETPRRRMRDLASEVVERYWINEGEGSDDQLIRGQNGGFKDHAGMAALVAASAGATAYDANLGLGLLGLNVAYAARLPVYKKLFEIQEERQLVSKSVFFRGLLRATTPLSIELTTTTFRNALTSLKLNDVKSKYSSAEQNDDQSVALFGNGHALGAYIWNNEKAQKKIVAKEVKKMERIAEELNGASLTLRQSKQLIEDIAFYLGGVGIWKVLDKPQVLSYKNFDKAVPRVDSIVSSSVTSVIEGVFATS